MTRIDIISGFLGAGKTTLIKKLLGDALKGQQVVLIENEFGEIGIDGGFLKDAGIEIREMNSGCICCSLVGDFGAALKDVITKYHPDRIIIEPSGVGKLSDVIKAVDGVEKEAGVALNSATTVVDVMKCKMYLRNFGEFFENQVKSAGTIILSRTDKADTEKVEAAVKMLRELNPEAHIITTPVEVLGGKKVLDTMEGAIINLAQVEEEEHHHHHHDHDECCCGHDHDEEHEHHHHDHDEDEHEHHHHDHDGECCCGHDHDEEHEHHHHDHDASCSSFIVSTATLYNVMVVVMMFMFVLIMIVMMVLMLLIVVMAAAALVVVMMMVMMLFLFYLRKVDDGTFHRIEYFLTTQYFNRCGNNVCFRIQFAEHFYSCLYFFRIGFIGTAQDDGSCALYLILEEFAEVSEIHFAFHNVDYGCCGIQGYACFFFYTVYSLGDVGVLHYGRTA